MKTQLLLQKFLLIIILFSATVSAQIVLNADRKPQAGDSFTIMDMDTVGVTEGSTGTNATWNFSNLSSTGEQMLVNYINPSEAPNSELFPGSDVAVSYDGLSYTFYDTDGNTVYSLGSSYEDFSIVYSNTEKVSEFPFTFNSTFLDNFQAQYELGEGLIDRNIGITQFTGDAVGNIILPDGSNHSALRVKIFRHTTDTMLVSGIPLSTTEVKSTTYEWYTNEMKYPVFGISYIELNVNGSVTNHKVVEYNVQSPTDVDENPQQLVNEFDLLQNYPNPFNPSTVINYQISKSNRVTLKVYDIIGNEIATLVNNHQPAGKYSVEFNASNLPSGIYLYRLEAGDFVQTRKMTLIK